MERLLQLLLGLLRQRRLEDGAAERGRASTALSGVTLSTTRKSAEVPGCSMSRTRSSNSLLIPLLVIFPIRAPMPAPTAMPRTGTKKSIPNRKPQNIPQVVPLPTALMVRVTLYLPSLPRHRRDRIGLDDEILGESLGLLGGRVAVVSSG